jgi:hypothetical protein
MIEISKEQLEAFLSKTEFDFSSPDGWKKSRSHRLIRSDPNDCCSEFDCGQIV